MWERAQDEGLEHDFRPGECFWHVVSDFVGVFANLDVGAFKQDRIQVGRAFEEERIGNVDADVGSAFAGETESMQDDGFLFRCAVLDVFVPVVEELFDSVGVEEYVTTVCQQVLRLDEWG